MKKALLAIAGGILLSSQAMAVSVDGVTWDPNVFNDFEGHTNYGQWITPTNQTQSPINVAPLIASAIFPNFANPAALVGNYLTGVGEFNAFNIDTTSPNSPIGGVAPSFFVGGELTYAFGGIKITAFDSTKGFTFSGGWVNVYADQAPITNFNPAVINDSNLVNAQTNINKAVDGNLFLSLNIDSLVFTGFSFDATTLGGTVNALFSVTGGDAKDYFNTNTQALGADISYTSSSFFKNSGNTNRNIATGTADMVGDTTVPEPTMISLLGLGLLGFGAMARRKAG